ncbi:hydroxymethylbilane synthase [Roseomonas mucosa]|uniref:Porphobilinogen deaminase n=1 Tax=Roseomonas mucosa TaxID=207340 RepID=A0A1S8D9P1_9PROT|nr:hydroxymethylbilane synthase [Roseomonas mucosa]MBS5903576.1 hydroxymethylbilane synthase [Acetobacteraceae bacterium]MDT8290321.1 hydroxymethylbilane synthase [Roseomonas mucosa]MDT8314474.1 hydroxymethylbilane synthase [Roseomonas mucosa]MDT8352529.1 hydroxymethylbilane synthase [Roseomonas mucosa]MDT8360679.1 hydroxymethylbilane synthase [Roseomonas mucosa]
MSAALLAPALDPAPAAPDRAASLPAAPVPPSPGLAKESRLPALWAGTRGSPLALAQTREVLALLGGEGMTGGRPVRARVVGTTGDRVQGRRLADIGGKGLFTKEIHEALLDGRVDFAVHSLKDLETELPPGLVIAGVLPREDVRDALVLGPAVPPVFRRGALPELPQGARIGTASVRREAQLRHLRPDLRFGLLRGNVGTRLRVLEGGDFAATLLAMAGLRRLGLEHAAVMALDPEEELVPAAGQGIIAVTAREEDVETRRLFAMIDHRPTRIAATAERALLASLGGSCRTPVGAHARMLPGGRLRLTGLLAREDGSFLLKRGLEGAPGDAARLGQELGAWLRAGSPADILP